MDFFHFYFYHSCLMYLFGRYICFDRSILSHPAAAAAAAAAVGASELCVGMMRVGAG